MAVNHLREHWILEHAPHILFKIREEDWRKLGILVTLGIKLEKHGQLFHRASWVGGLEIRRRKPKYLGRHST